MARRGMTLIELLLAVTLFAALLAAIGGLVLSSVRASDNWGKTLEPYQQLEIGLNRLAQDCESAQRLFVAPTSGSASRFELARINRTTKAEAETAVEWRRLVYRFQPEAEGVVLIREEYLLGNPQEGQPVQREALIRLKSGRFEFAQLDAQHAMQWVPAWDGAKHGIPQLIKFTGTLPDTVAAQETGVTRIIRNPAGNLPLVEGS